MDSFETRSTSRPNDLFGSMRYSNGKIMELHCLNYLDPIKVLMGTIRIFWNVQGEAAHVHCNEAIYLVRLTPSLCYPGDLGKQTKMLLPLVKLEQDVAEKSMILP